MKDRSHSSSHQRTGRRAFALGFVASTMLLAASPAHAQTTIDINFIFNLTKEASTASKIMDYAGKIQSGISAAQAVLEMTGMLDPGVTPEEILQEMQQIAKYQDTQNKYLFIVDADADLENARAIMQEEVVTTSDGKFVGIQPEFEDDLFLTSKSAVTKFLDPNNFCTIHPLFQTLDFNSGTQGLGKEANYEWRTGMSRALQAVSVRLMALAMLDPDFKQNISTYAGELDSIRQCLIRHRDLISPPKPFTFCEPDWGIGGGPNGSGGGCGQLNCYDHRSWPLWYTKHSAISFPLCKDFVDGSLFCSNPPTGCDDPYLPSFASHVQFEDLRASATTTIEHDNLPILYPLQKTIDILSLLTSSNPDLTQVSQRIPFGANPQLCLSEGGNHQGSIEVPSLQDCSTGSAVGWMYDRGTGRIKSATTGRCLAVGQAGSPVGTSACTDEVTDEGQIWNFNTETHKLKSMTGLVLTVPDAGAPSTSAPTAGAKVTADYEHLWKLHKQVWTDGVSTSCSGAICPATGAAAWTQIGVDGDTQVRYPIDFNLFTYFGASGLTDVRGPVAANGTAFPTVSNESRGTLGGISAANFFINQDSGLATAIVEGGGVLWLQNGTVMNAIRLDSQVRRHDPMSYTFLGWDRSIHQPSKPVNFEMALLKLQGMSSGLLNYSVTGSTTVRYNNTLEFKSTDVHANPQVFVVNGKSLLGPTNRITSIQFIDVPNTATVIVNVGGDDVVIQNAGVAGFPGYSKMIWNFYQAKRLRMASTGMVGSILAPFADVRLTSGYVTGTVASWSVTSIWGGEFHYGQFRNNAVVTGS